MISIEKQLVAHIRYEGQQRITHPLICHLEKVAELAQEFAGQRGSLFAYYAGLLHDLGKYQPRFQNYIRQAARQDQENAHIEDTEASNPQRSPHSTAGARYAVEHLDPILAYILSYVIAGHHAGLADWHTKGSLKLRLQNADLEYKESLSNIEESLTLVLNSLDSYKLLENLPDFMKSSETFRTELHILIRYLFSCLVDSDFLDTEAFMYGLKNAKEAKDAKVRPTFPSLLNLHERYTAFMEKLTQNSNSNSALNQERKAILQQCFEAASVNRQIFSLTVPTGGGKTLASLGFALKHALQFNKKRIIYAIPYTSIIEQNATVFRQALGDEAILEHHSTLEVNHTKENSLNRLAAENWDAPIIATTNVQFFESLFAARPSRCRKFHNIADSIVILDEAQQIPRDFQKPITDFMQALARDYGTTFVLCTATQPELGKDVDVFGRVQFTGLDKIHEIIKDKTLLAQKLRRVNITLPSKNTPKQSWEEIAKEIAQKDCVLAIVNTRKHARELFAALPAHGIKLHLSANMCPNHRAETIALIKHYLKFYRQGILHRPLWVVSTQLIEAGVDLDLPVVYRAMAGLDSIAQAAGRCNREGRLPNGKLGNVVVFRPLEDAPAGPLKQGQEITEIMIQSDLINDPLAPETFASYFKRFNTRGERDKHKITELLTVESPTEQNPLAIEFRTAAERFRMIDNNGIAVIVPFVPLAKRTRSEQPIIIKNTELAEYFDEHLKPDSIDDWPSILQELRYPNFTDDSFGQTTLVPLPEPLETWMGYLESDPLKNKWVYRELQRYSITISEYELKKLPSNVIDERAGLLILSNAYYDSESLGALTLSSVSNLKQTVF